MSEINQDKLTPIESWGLIDLDDATSEKYNGGFFDFGGLEFYRDENGVLIGFIPEEAEKAPNSLLPDVQT